jgi:predicted NBD/HSP70 family sugar kinase
MATITKAADRGHNATRIRALNTRTVLGIVYRERQISRAALSRATGLSPPAISAIVAELVENGFLEKKSRQSGAVGSPSTLFGLRRAAAFSIGLHIGRRATTALLMDITGEVFAEARQDYAVPRVSEVTAFTQVALADWRTTVPDLDARLIGAGICSPKFFDYSAEDLGYPETIRSEWQAFEAATALGQAAAFPIFEENDANAAALAELEWGAGSTVRNFFYVSIGTFIGGGLVLDGRLVRGPQGLAATFGPFPVTPSRLASATPRMQDFDFLYRRASLFVLRNHLRHAGFAPEGEGALGNPDPAWAQAIAEWTDDAALALSQAIQGVAAIIDVEAVILDSPLPQPVLETLIERTQTALTDSAGKMIVRPEIRRGTAGRQPSVRGAAMVPFSELLGIGNSHSPS